MDRETISTILIALNERRNRLISTKINEGATAKMRMRLQDVNRAIRAVEAMRSV
jgi:hypothetical protein